LACAGVHAVADHTPLIGTIAPQGMPFEILPVTVTVIEALAPVASGKAALQEMVYSDRRWRRERPRSCRRLTGCWWRWRRGSHRQADAVSVDNDVAAEVDAPAEQSVCLGLTARPGPCDSMSAQPFRGGAERYFA
jgi:hypothetical protein